MNLSMLKARQAEIVEEMKKLVDGYAERSEDFSDEDQKRFDELDKESADLAITIETLQKRTDAIERAEKATEGGSDTTKGRTKKRDRYDLSEVRWDTSPQQLRGMAKGAITEDEILPDDLKERAVQRLVEVDRRGEVAKLILATGHPKYRSGFQKVVAGAEWALDRDEREALQRAQSLTNASGGFAVPFTLDPTVLLTNNGTINPLRQMAQVKTITTDEWNGVTSAGATANWRGEAEQAGDDSITLTQPNIPVHKMDIFIPYSIEIEMDWAQIESELRMAMMDAKDRKEATAFVTGTGTLQPTGIVTALDGTSSELSPATAETFAQADVFDVRRQLPPRYRMTSDMAKWLANIGTYDSVRQFDTGGGGGFWTDMTNGTPDRLLGSQTYESSEMDDAQDINAAVTADNFILIYGMWSRYVIVDRIGMRVENIPHLFGTANNRPTGQRGLYAIARVGADSIDDNAFRMLNVATTA